MFPIILRILFWGGLYLCMATLPLLFVNLGGAPVGRSFATELGVALGMIGYAMLALQFFTIGRLWWVTPYLGTDAEIHFHREMGIAALFFVFAHPLILILAEPKFLAYFDPTENFLRAVLLSLALIALLLIIVLSVWRTSLRLKYEIWLLTHGLMACGVLFIGLVHSIQVGHYINGFRNQLLVILIAASAFSVYGYVRLIAPLRARNARWRVAELEEDCPHVTRLVLEPEGHRGLRFRAGQYVWITLGESKLPVKQHPFSLMSSEFKPGRLEFGIKQLGDFTENIQQFSVGTVAYLSGPHGSFLLSPQARGASFVVGGIGITPVLSILWTCRDRKDRRPLQLIYANVNEEEIPFRDDLDQLTQELNLEVIHVLEEPSENWQGETGRITEELLDRYLNFETNQKREFFTCGPPPLMEIVEETLVKRGVPARRIISEHFDLV